MSKVKINLPSRYNEVTSSLEQSDDDPNMFELRTNSQTIRVVFEKSPKTIMAIDLEGGPFMEVDDKNIYEGHTLKKIVEDKERFKLIFTKDEDKE